MNPNDAFEKNVNYKLELIKHEHEELQRIIARMDNLIFAVRGWVITVWVAIVTFSPKEAPVKPKFILISLGIILLFASIDICYKGFQEQFRKRTRLLEDILNGVDFTNSETLEALLKFRSPAITDALQKFTPKFLVSIIIYRPYVSLLYIGLIVLSLIIYFSF